MRIFLTIATICVFTFSTFSGASIRTVAEMKTERNYMAAKLTTLSLKQLGQVQI